MASGKNNEIGNTDVESRYTIVVSGGLETEFKGGASSNGMGQFNKLVQGPRSCCPYVLSSSMDCLFLPHSRQTQLLKPTTSL